MNGFNLSSVSFATCILSVDITSFIICTKNQDSTVSTSTKQPDLDHCQQFHFVWIVLLATSFPVFTNKNDIKLSVSLLLSVKFSVYVNEKFAVLLMIYSGGNMCGA